MIQKHIESLKKKYKKNSKIVVAMSGGVDSSVTAALLHRAGFEVIGITLQLYRNGNTNTKFKTCCSGKDIKDAQNVALKEGFKHYILDYTTKFQEKVIDDFVNSYEKGITPVPCGRCNQYIKFGYLLEFSKTIKADILVTGHYVKKENNKLFRSHDKLKDQSYFLALTTPEQIQYIDFPLADINKTDVKLIAKEIGLIVANKAESMDICFIPDGDYKSFLKKIRPEMFQKGPILSTNQEKLGEHNGLACYTVGQRKGLNLNNGPWYVKKLDPPNNTLIVCSQKELLETSFSISEVNLLISPKEFENKEIYIQIRAKQQPALGMYNPTTRIATFFSPQPSICKGQICALYDQDQLLGGGIIEKTYIHN